MNIHTPYIYMIPYSGPPLFTLNSANEAGVVYAVDANTVVTFPRYVELLECATCVQRNPSHLSVCHSFVSHSTVSAWYPLFSVVSYPSTISLYLLIYLPIHSYTYTHSGSTFAGNVAITGRGGVFYGLYSASLTVGSNALFDGNRAVVGGAIALVERCILNLGDDSRISSSQATNVGGAIWMGVYSRFIGASNITLTNSSAGGVGGAMYISGGSSVVFNA